jgi:hypothetical protein
MDKTVDKDRQLALPGVELSPMDMDISKLCAKMVVVDEDFRGNLKMAIEDYDHVKKKEDIEEYIDAIFQNMPFIHLRLFGKPISSTINYNILSYVSTMTPTNKFSKALVQKCKAELARKFTPVNKAS